MTPREVIMKVVAGFEDGVDDDLAAMRTEDLLEGLAAAGFVIVPRNATAAMCMAQGNPAYPSREIWDAMIAEATKQTEDNHGNR